MIRSVTVKTGLCAAAFFLSLSIGGVKAEAETTISDSSIAGITAAIDTCYNAATDKDTTSADKYMETLIGDEEKETKVESPYANLGISDTNDYVNIRSKPSTDSEIVGKLYSGCAADILDQDGDWVKIKSGKVDGYINKDFLAIGDAAEALIDKSATKYATVVNTATLRVRNKPSMEDDVETITLIPEGETYRILKETKNWAKIQVDDGEDGETGFVSKDYIEVTVKFKYAISIEEEQAKEAAKAAAEQAKKERLEQLAIQQEEERKAAEQKKEAAQEASQQSSQQSDNKDDTTVTHASSGSGQAVASYAQKFVGNPYVWGGTSLTNGTDCSGFVQSLYGDFGKSIPRTSRDQSQNAGVEVSLSELQAGDLIFYRNSGGTVNHVAMYIGGGKVVHASNPVDGIKISAYNYRTPYKARRIY